MEDRGAGELLLTYIDRDGTGKGFDQNLVNPVAGEVYIPIIAHGGPSTAGHIESIIRSDQVDAVAIASMFHYGAINNDHDFSHHSEEGNVEFLKNRRAYKTFGTSDPIMLKDYLSTSGIPCRTQKGMH